MISRDELAKRLSTRFTMVVDDKKKIKELQDDLHKKYNIPVDLANDFLTMRSNIAESDDFILYCFCKEFLPTRLHTYFSELEREEYEDKKWEVKKLKFPLRYDMFELAEDQFVGKITLKELMELQENQVIRYNEAIQRPMTRVVNGEKEHWEITVVQKAVKEIEQSIRNDTYIPNFITFNIPQNVEYHFNNGVLEIGSKEPFKLDILDGYHRLLALSRIYYSDKKFKYSMGLQITAFPQLKAEHFIYQEDQKNKMKKVASASYQNNVSNKICQRLNGDVNFNLVGNISRNNGKINMGILAVVIEKVYETDKITKQSETSSTIQLTNGIREGLNQLTLANPDMLDRKWDNADIACAIYCVKNDCISEFQDLKGKADDRKLFKRTNNIGLDLRSLRK